MKDFLTDEEMAQLESEQEAPISGDFISDEDMIKLETKYKPTDIQSSGVDKFSQFAEGISAPIKFGAEMISPTIRAIESVGVSLAGPAIRAGQKLIPGGKTGKEYIKLETPFGTAKELRGMTGREFAGTAFELGTTFLPAKLLGKAFTPLANKAQKLYQSVLKPSNKLVKAGVVQTGLKEGIVISKKGLEKAKGIMEDIGENISRVIDTGIAEGKTINKKDLIPYSDELKEYFKNVMGGKEYIQQVSQFTKKFIDELPEIIPIKKAQEIKQATQKFVAKYYNREAPIKFEVQKQLARGLKEEIAKQVPEISKLNARDTKLFGLEDAMESALKRLGNREIFNLSDVVSFGAGAVSGGAASTGVAGTIAYRLLKSPAFSSSRAIFYNKLANNAEKAIKAVRWPVVGAISSIINALED